VDRPGIGSLALERGPGDLYVWHVRQPPTSSLYRAPVEVDIG
jgi:hypothetical protein